MEPRDPMPIQYDSLIIFPNTPEYALFQEMERALVQGFKASNLVALEGGVAFESGKCTADLYVGMIDWGFGVSDIEKADIAYGLGRFIANAYSQRQCFPQKVRSVILDRQIYTGFGQGLPQTSASNVIYSITPIVDISPRADSATDNGYEILITHIEDIGFDHWMANKCERKN